MPSSPENKILEIKSHLQNFNYD